MFIAKTTEISFLLTRLHENTRFSFSCRFCGSLTLSSSEPPVYLMHHFIQVKNHVQCWKDEKLSRVSKMFFEESSRRLSKDAFLVPSFKTSFESSSGPSQWLSSTILNTKSSTPSQWLSSELPGMPRKEIFMVPLSEPSQE